MRAHLLPLLIVYLSSIASSSYISPEKMNYLGSQASLGDTYIRIFNLLSFNAMSGFMEGFYDSEAEVEDGCLGETTFQKMRSSFELMTELRKDNFFMHLAKVLRNSVQVLDEMRDKCMVSKFFWDISKFCESHCEGKKIMTRVMASFSVLSQIYNEIYAILYERDPETMVDEYAMMQELGSKAGEFLRILTGFDPM